MLLFSKRNFYENSDPLIIDYINEETKKSLWSTINLFIWEKVHSSAPLFKFKYNNPDIYTMVQGLYKNVMNVNFQETEDNFNKTLEEIKNFFFKSSFQKQFDFVEFIISNYPKNLFKEIMAFVHHVDEIFIREKANFRVINKKIVPKVLGVEKKSIQKTILATNEKTALFLKKSLDNIFKKTNYSYAINEALNGLKIFFEEYLDCNTQNLGPSISKLSNKHRINFNSTFIALTQEIHNLTIDSMNMKHNLNSKSNLNCADIKFINLVLSSIISYLDKKSEGPIIQNGLNRAPEIGQIIYYIERNNKIKLIDSIIGMRNIFTNMSHDLSGVYNCLFAESSPGFDEAICTLAITCHTINFFLEKVE